MEEIYVCFPGEYVLYKGDGRGNASVGLLCRVECIKRGKVQLTEIHSGREILSSPHQFIDCGEYGIEEEDPECFDMECDADDDCMFLDGASDDGDNDAVNSSTTSPADEEHTFLQGKSLFLSKQYAAAYVVLSNLFQIAQCTRNRVQTARMAASCAAVDGHFESALAILMQCAGAEPTNIPLVCSIGKVYEDSGRMDEALAWYQRARAEDALSAAPAYYLANILLRHDRTAHAAQFLALLTSCCMECRQIDPLQSPAEATSMYLHVADILHSLGGSVELRLRALLRAINIARHNGALSQVPSQLPAAGLFTAASVQQMEALQLRGLACDALYALGQTLEGTGMRMIADYLQALPSNRSFSSAGEESWQTIQKGSSAPKTKRAKAAAPEESAPGMGYLGGALGAYEMCRGLNVNADTAQLYAEAVERMSRRCLK
jgi:tetratricopeptide (TPR) repeat protein